MNMNKLNSIIVFSCMALASTSTHAEISTNALTGNALTGNGLSRNALTGNALNLNSLKDNGIHGNGLGYNGPTAQHVTHQGRTLPSPPAREASCGDAARPGCRENPFFGLSKQALGR